MDWKDILALPEACWLEKRLPKAFFLRNFELKSGEKRLLNECVEQMHWLASIKPGNSNVPAYTDATHSYEEVQIFHVELRDSTVRQKGEALAELIQKYLPYALLLIISDGEEYMINVCTKRINQANAKKRSIEERLSSSPISVLYRDERSTALHEALAFSSLELSNLQSLYLSYLQALVAHRSAGITGRYARRGKQRSAADLERLKEMDELQLSNQQLHKAIKTAHNMNEQVELNMRIQRNRERMAALEQELKEI